MGNIDDTQKKIEESGFEEEKEYAFMQETIKDENRSVKRTKNLIFKYAGLGLVFGIAASLGFCALKPWAESRFQKDPEEVTIPVEEEEEQDVVEETEVVVDQALTIDNYRELNKALVQVADEAEKSVVVVSAETEDSQWKSENYNKKNEVSGILLADNGQEFLIFAKTAILKDALSLRATFADGKSYSAFVKVKDENLGFAIYTVKKLDVQESTIKAVKMADLGSSNYMNRGDVVIALGSPFGYSEGVGFGIVASKDNVIKKVDGEYGLLTTDIAGAANGTGVLVNIRGEVVGMIDQSVTGEAGDNLITAYGITNLKLVMENLSNGNQVPYIGVKGITITETIANEQGIPQGVYVQEVAADSPAMEAGIQSGDIITKMGKEEVELLSVYSTKLMRYNVGDEIKIEGQRQGAGGYVDIDFTVTVGSKE